MRALFSQEADKPLRGWRRFLSLQHREKRTDDGYSILFFFAFVFKDQQNDMRCTYVTSCSPLTSPFPCYCNIDKWEIGDVGEPSGYRNVEIERRERNAEVNNASGKEFDSGFGDGNGRRRGRGGDDGLNRDEQWICSLEKERDRGKKGRAAARRRLHSVDEEFNSGGRLPLRGRPSGIISLFSRFYP